MAHAEAFPIHLGDRGRLVLPAEIRKRLSLRQGDQLLISVELDGSLRLTNAQQAVRETRGLYRGRARHRSLVDELIADRRREARRESAPR
jgi:AbrB family looped-hinge helix DNA binding protein